MSKATHVMPVVDADEYKPGDGTIDPFETTPQIADADGKSDFGLPEVEGGDRATESIEKGIYKREMGEQTSEPTFTPSTVSTREAAESETPKKAPAKRAPRKTAEKPAEEKPAEEKDDADKADA